MVLEQQGVTKILAEIANAVLNPLHGDQPAHLAVARPDAH